MLVMASDHKVGPGAFRYGIEVGINGRLKRDRIPFEQRETQRQMHARLAVSIEMADPISLALHLAAEKSFLILVKYFPDVFDAVHGFRSVISKYRVVLLRRWCFFVGLR